MNQKMELQEYDCQLDIFKMLVHHHDSGAQVVLSRSCLPPFWLRKFCGDLEHERDTLKHTFDDVLVLFTRKFSIVGAWSQKKMVQNFQFENNRNKRVRGHRKMNLIARSTSKLI